MLLPQKSIISIILKELQTDFELYTDTSFGEQANIGVFNA